MSDSDKHHKVFLSVNASCCWYALLRLLNDEFILSGIYVLECLHSFIVFFSDDSRITVLYPAIGFVTAVVSYGYWHYGIEELLR